MNILVLVPFPTFMNTVVLGIHGRLVSRPPWLTESEGAQVPYIKWHSTVGSLYLWILRAIIIFLKVG